MAGLLYGIAALLLVSRTGVGDPKAGHREYNLDSITAVVLGGTSLFGGRGLVIGTLIGAVIVGVFRNGLQLMQIDSIYQTLVTGVLVILAVTVDQLSRKKDPLMTTSLHSRMPGSTRQRDPAARRPAAWSSGTATSPPSTAPTSTCCPARCWPSSATTAPASPS